MEELTGGGFLHVVCGSVAIGVQDCGGIDGFTNNDDLRLGVMGFDPADAAWLLPFHIDEYDVGLAFVWMDACGIKAFFRETDKQVGFLAHYWIGHGIFSYGYELFPAVLISVYNSYRDNHFGSSFLFVFHRSGVDGHFLGGGL